MEGRMNYNSDAAIAEEEDMGTGQQPRLSFFFDSTAIKPNSNKDRVIDEIDRIEQLITVNLQKINENLMTSNSIISNRLIPTIENFNTNSSKIYNNISHIKEFFENAANVNILTRKDVDIQEGNDNNISSTSFEQYGQKFNSDEGNMSMSSFNKLNSDNSEFKIIKDRYRNNLDLTDTNEFDTNKLPQPLSREDPTSSTFMKDFKTNLDDESTSRQPVLHNSFTNFTEKLQCEVDANIDDENQEKDSSSTNLVKGMMNGYESPPWQEPPELRSSKVTTQTKDSKKRRRSNSTSGNITSNDDEIHTDEDVSIRFPQSPKYGSGGKLLRTEKGRQKALDFARSEMLKDHPILSLQSDSQKDTTATFITANNTNINNRSDSSEDNSSSFDEAPALLSGNL